MRSFVVTSLLGLLLSAPATAGVEGAHVSLSPYAGTPIWDADVGLDAAPMTGARAAGMIRPWLGVEGTFGFTNTETDFDGAYATDVRHVGVDVLMNLMASRRVSPYLVGGWSELRYDSDDRNDVTGGTPYTFSGFEFGGGLNIALKRMPGSSVSLRLDARDVVTNLVQWFPDHEDAHHNVLLSAGLSFAFGRGPTDSDGDGVADAKDDCPSTPRFARVDGFGCAKDTDCDGVYDGLDQCANTPPGLEVDDHGCPTGLALVPIGEEPLDTAPPFVAPDPEPVAATPPPAAKPVVQTPPPPPAPPVTPVRDTAKPASPRHDAERVVITFKHASDWVDFRQRRDLDGIARMLLSNPSLRLEVRGHADDTGPMDLNENMATARAERVREYIRSRFPSIGRDRLVVHGYGEYVPVVDGVSPEARSANRRVDFRVLP